MCVLVCSFSVQANNGQSQINPSVYTVDVCSNNQWFDVPIEISHAVNQCIGFDVEISYDETVAVPTGVILLNNSLVHASYMSYVYVIDENAIRISFFLNGNGGLQYFNGKGILATVEFEKIKHFENPFLLATTLLASYEDRVEESKLLPVQCIEYACSNEEEQSQQQPLKHMIENDNVIELQAIAYPNPVLESLYVLSNQKVTVHIRDASNQVRAIYANIPAHTSVAIDMSGLQSGVYFITAYTSVQSKKMYVIKQ